MPFLPFLFLFGFALAGDRPEPYVGPLAGEFFLSPTQREAVQFFSGTPSSCRVTGDTRYEAHICDALDDGRVVSQSAHGETSYKLERVTAVFRVLSTGTHREYRYDGQETSTGEPIRWIVVVWNNAPVAVGFLQFSRLNLSFSARLATLP